jgi:hypothetical protein
MNDRGEHRFSETSLTLIGHARDIITDYRAQGYVLTLRQLYYQLVSRNLIPNFERSYKNLSALMTEARYADVIDPDTLEDRIRQPVIPTEFQDLDHLVQAALAGYRLDRWQGQPHRVELWCEKDALASVLAPIATEHHVTLMVNRGYSSFSAMYESAERITALNEETLAGDEPVILYLGDHDPSGKDMVRDIHDRLDRFDCPVDIRPIALTRAQVDQYQLPPQPAKTTDARYSAYAVEHGDGVWELDALPPDVLAGLVRNAIVDLIDHDVLAGVLAQEARDKTQLEKAVRSLTRRKGAR